MAVSSPKYTAMIFANLDVALDAIYKNQGRSG